LQAYVERYPSQNKASESLKGVSAGTVSTILGGKYENISDEMFRKLAAQVGGENATGWQIVETKAYHDMSVAMRDAQEMHFVTWIVGSSGCGKTTAARLYALEHREVFYIDCRKDMRRNNFIACLARSIGIRIEGRSTYEALDYIMGEVIQMENPLIILNEADKLCEDVFLYIIDMYNTMEDYAGIVFLSTNQIKRRMDLGLRHNKKGYQEINSRIGQKLFELDAINANDVHSICVANGIKDDSKINRIIKDADNYDFDLRRVKKLVQVAKRLEKK
jgi:DNA transposition AAA+ family ATPase